MDLLPEKSICDIHPDKKIDIKILAGRVEKLLKKGRFLGQSCGKKGARRRNTKGQRKRKRGRESELEPLFPLRGEDS